MFLAGYGLARRFTRPGPVLTDPADSEAVGPMPPAKPPRNTAEGKAYCASPSGSARFSET